MTTQDKPEVAPEQSHIAAQHVANAHYLLRTLRDKLDKHPELEEAIERLEMALTILTTNTGGML